MIAISAFEENNTVVCGMVMNPEVGDSSGRTIAGNTEYVQINLGTGGAAANAMGNLTVTNLTFNDNAVFDWEISDFNSGANQSSFNDEFDVLNFDTLTFGSGAESDLLITRAQGG